MKKLLLFLLLFSAIKLASNPILIFGYKFGNMKMNHEDSQYLFKYSATLKSLLSGQALLKPNQENNQDDNSIDLTAIGYETAYKITEVLKLVDRYEKEECSNLKPIIKRDLLQKMNNLNNNDLINFYSVVNFLKIDVLKNIVLGKLRSRILSNNNEQSSVFLKEYLINSPSELIENLIEPMYYKKTLDLKPKDIFIQGSTLCLINQADILHVLHDQNDQIINTQIKVQLQGYKAHLCKISKDESTVIAIGKDGNLHIFDTSTSYARTIQLNQDIKHIDDIAISYDGATIAVLGTADKTEEFNSILYVYDNKSDNLKENNNFFKIKKNAEFDISLNLSENGQTITVLARDWNGPFMLYIFNNQAQILGKKDGIYGVTKITKDGSKLIATGVDIEGHILDNYGNTLNIEKLPVIDDESDQEISISEDESTITFCDENQNLQVFDISGKWLNKGNPIPINYFGLKRKMSTDGNRIVTIGVEKEKEQDQIGPLLILDKNGKKLNQESPLVNKNFKISACGSTIIARLKNNLYIFDKSGDLLKKVEFKQNIEAANVNLDGSTIATIENNTLYIFNNTGNLITQHELPTHTKNDRVHYKISINESSFVFVEYNFSASIRKYKGLLIFDNEEEQFLRPVESIVGFDYNSNLSLIAGETTEGLYLISRKYGFKKLLESLKILEKMSSEDKKDVLTKLGRIGIKIDTQNSNDSEKMAKQAAASSSSEVEPTHAENANTYRQKRKSEDKNVEAATSVSVASDSKKLK